MVVKKKPLGFKEVTKRKMEEVDFVTGKINQSSRKNQGHCAKSGLWVAFNSAKLDRRTRLSIWIEKTRKELVEELGGSLTVQQKILVARTIMKMAKCHLYEMGVLCNPANSTGSRDYYLALSNSLRLDLAVLFPDGLRRKEKVLDLNEYIKEKYGDQR